MVWLSLFSSTSSIRTKLGFDNTFDFVPSETHSTYTNSYVFIFKSPSLSVIIFVGFGILSNVLSTRTDNGWLVLTFFYTEKVLESGDVRNKGWPHESLVPRLISFQYETAFLVRSRTFCPCSKGRYVFSVLDVDVGSGTADRGNGLVLVPRRDG